MYENIKVGDKLTIHCYKHNGKIHRTWDEAVVLDINEEMIVCGNNKARVTENDGRTHKTNEPAVMFFYRNHWFNVIGQLKKFGLYYYCNIATPFIIDDNIIKYIDYDLDLRIFPDGCYRVLDKNEYNYHKKIMNYSTEIDYIIKQELNTLISMNKMKSGPFSDKVVENYFKIYKFLQKNAQNG